MKKIIYFLGLNFKFIRNIYFRQTGKWLWGLYCYVNDNNIVKNNFDKLFEEFLK